MTEDQKNTTIENKKLVDECYLECRKLIFEKIKHKKDRDVFLIYSRIILLFFSIHFGASINAANEILEKENIDCLNEKT